MSEIPLGELPPHQAMAIKLLSDCLPKPVVALDLDYTLWPSNCFEMTAPPYESSHNVTVGNHHNLDLSYVGRPDVIFCTDKRTETIKPFALYPETRQVLEFCAEYDIVLTIVSRSPDVNVVEQILQAYGIWEWFLFPQIYYKRKTFHFRNLTEATGFKMRDFLFFDDEPANITMCNRMGVNTCLVDKSQGLNWSTFIQGLQVYKEKALLRKSFVSSIDKMGNALSTLHQHHRHDSSTEDLPIQIESPTNSSTTATMSDSEEIHLSEGFQIPS